MQAPDRGNEDGAIPREQPPGKPTTRRYSEEEAAAVRMVRTLRAELGSEHGTVIRVAERLGYGVEPVRLWVRQADIDDGHEPRGTHGGGGADPGAGARTRELCRAHDPDGSRRCGRAE